VTKTKNMRNIYLLLFLCSLFSKAQFENFPKDQSPYDGGMEKYYEDFHRIIVEKKLQPCTNTDELYHFKVLIMPDSTIKFVKDSDEKDVIENKCAYNLARAVAKFQTGWKPAIINGQRTATIAEFLIYPDDLFEKYQSGYDSSSVYTLPMYSGGINKFREQVSKNIDLSKFNWTGKFRVVTRFVVERDGSISNVILEESSGLKEFDEMVIKSIKKIRNQWTPGKIHSRSVRSYMKFPLTFSMD